MTFEFQMTLNVTFDAALDMEVEFLRLCGEMSLKRRFTLQRADAVCCESGRCPKPDWLSDSFSASVTKKSKALGNSSNGSYLSCRFPLE